MLSIQTDAKPKSKEEEALEEQEKNDPFPILEVQLFANITFTTRKGLGQDMILRGKWWIIGDQRDCKEIHTW